jgi:hypothetical protein
MENIETYKIQAKCENCNTTWNEVILKGVFARGYYRCPYCGCKEGKSQGRAGDTGLVVN